MSAIILITNLLGLKHSGQVANMEKDITLVGRTIEMLRSSRHECVCPLTTPLKAANSEHLT